MSSSSVDHRIPLLSLVSRVGIGFFLLAVVILTNQLGVEEDADGERHDQQDGQDGDHRDEAHVTQAAAERWILLTRGSANWNIYIYMRFHLYFFYVKSSLSLCGAYVVIKC